MDGNEEQPLIEFQVDVTYPTCIRGSFSAVTRKEWKGPIEDMVHRVSHISRHGSCIFNHFLLEMVVSGKMQLPNKLNELQRLINACFSAVNPGTSVSKFRQKDVFREWVAVLKKDIGDKINPNQLPTVRGLGNALTEEINVYLRNFKRHLKDATINAYVRVLNCTEDAFEKKCDAKKEVTRRLVSSPYFKGCFEDSIIDNNDETDDLVQIHNIKTHHEALMLLYSCQQKLAIEQDRRKLEDEELKKKKKKRPRRPKCTVPTLAPVNSFARRKVKIDNNVLYYMAGYYNVLDQKPLQEYSLEDVFDYKSPVRKGHVLGASVLTDAVQIIPRWEKTHTETWKMSEEKYNASKLRKTEREEKIRLYGLQNENVRKKEVEIQALRTKVSQLQGQIKEQKELICVRKSYIRAKPVELRQELNDLNEASKRTVMNLQKEMKMTREGIKKQQKEQNDLKVIKWSEARPFKPTYGSHDVPLRTNGLGGATSGFFSQKAISEMTGCELPSNLVFIDPGHSNIWSAVQYNHKATGKEKYNKVFELSNGQYRNGIGLRRFQNYMKSSLERPEMKEAQIAMTNASLRTPSAKTFASNMVIQADARDTLYKFYGGRRYAKRRFVQQIQKQSYEDNLINDFIRKCEVGEKAPIVVAYGDGQFPLSMPGCNGGTPHARLCRKLAQKRVVVKTNECLTTKRCPNCKIETHPPKGTKYDSEVWRMSKMVQPRGVDTFTDRHGNTNRKRVHGLSHCSMCHKQWSRDYAAAINIGNAFIALWLFGERPEYLKIQKIPNASQHCLDSSSDTGVQTPSTVKT